jgi:hypothetical protein
MQRLLSERNAGLAGVDAFVSMPIDESYLERDRFSSRAISNFLPVHSETAVVPDMNGAPMGRSPIEGETHDGEVRLCKDRKPITARQRCLAGF